MDNPKIRIESDGMRTVVYVDGKKIERCISMDFHANVDNGIHVCWNGKTQKEDGGGHLIIENDEIVTEEFYYDSNEAVID